MDVADLAAGRGARGGLPVLRDIALKGRELAMIGDYELAVAVGGAALGHAALAAAAHAPAEARARLARLGFLDK